MFNLAWATQTNWSQQRDIYYHMDNFTINPDGYAYIQFESNTYGEWSSLNNLVLQFTQTIEVISQDGSRNNFDVFLPTTNDEFLCFFYSRMSKLNDPMLDGEIPVP